MTKTRTFTLPVLRSLYNECIQDELDKDSEALAIVIRMLILMDSLSPTQVDRIINTTSDLAAEYEGKANLIGDGELGDGFRSMADSYDKLAKLFEMVK